MNLFNPMHANRHPYNQEYLSPNKMGVFQQYHSKKYPNSSTSSSSRLLHLNIPSTSNFLYDKSDFIWSNPTELDLLHMKKAPLRMPTIDENFFLKVRPCLRRLYTIFNSIRPNIYRIHCSDSLRILQELICLIEEYLHIQSSVKISQAELLSNDEYLDDFIDQLRHLPLYKFYPNIYPPNSSPEIRCFGQGIRASDYKNQLNEKLLFCFEVTTSNNNSYSFPIEIVVLDPNENPVPNDIKYIHTYDRGYTKLFSCSYKPITQAGTYRISFRCNHIPLSTKPFHVLIRNSKHENEIPEQGLEIPSYELEGDGYSKKVVINSIARFRLRINPQYSKSMLDLFSLTILDPHAHPIVVKRRLLSFNLLELTYQPMSIGEHQLSIVFKNKLHRQMMIHVIDDEINCQSKFKPFGPGLQRAIVGLPTEFYVDLKQPTTNFNHHHPIQFSLEPSFHAEIDYEQQMATVRYTPLKQGDCPVHILEYDKDILHSPFIARIKQEPIPTDQPRIQVTGLSEQIILHRPVEFQVSIDNPFDDPNHSLHIEILADDTSPSVTLDRRDPSLYLCSFTPTTLGRLIICIDYAGIVANNNPFICQVIQDKDIQLTGPAIHSQCLTLNEPTHFYFKLNDFLTTKTSPEGNSTYESGYSSNEETSLNSSSLDSNRVNNPTDEDEHYRVTITDGHGNIKRNVLVKDIQQNNSENIRVDFTPDEQILFINISCTW